MFNNPDDLLYSARYNSSNQGRVPNPQAIYVDDSAYTNGASNYYQDFSPNTRERANPLNSKIKFNPKFFDTDLVQKKYKEPQIILSTKSQLPTVLITPQLRNRIQKNLSQPMKKDSYIFITKQSGPSAANKKFIIDEISLSPEEAIEENYYDNNKYPVLLVTGTPGDNSMGEFEDNLNIENEIELLSNLCKNCRAGSESLFAQGSIFNKKNTDFATPSSDFDVDQIDIQTLKSSDIIYLNTFRIFTFLLRSKNSSSSKCTVHRLLYFPNVSFRITSIQQPFKLVSTPLTNLLTKKQKSDSMDPMSNKKPDIKFGFVSLDANQRMLPVLVSDPLSAKIPLIGLWIYGINPQIELLEDDDQEKRVLQGILFEYINNPFLANRYSFDRNRKTFLLAIFSPEEGYRFYETEFMESTSNQEIDNRWVMLKASRETLNPNDAIDYLERNFILSPEAIVKDLASLKKDISEPAHQPNVRDSFASIKRSQVNNSLTDYLMPAPQSLAMRGNFPNNGNEEMESFEIDYQLPKPQPQPQPQPHLVNRFEDSKASQRTAAFIDGSEQTFAQDSRQQKLLNILTDSIKKGNPPPPSGNYHPQQWEAHPPQHQNTVNSHNAPEKLSPFAEQLLYQQAQQLRLLEEQIRSLQLALSYQTNVASQGLLPFLAGNQKFSQQLGAEKPQMVTKETQTDSVSVKKYETKFTNTSFSSSKEEYSGQNRSENKEQNTMVDAFAGANTIESFFNGGEQNMYNRNFDDRNESGPIDFERLAFSRIERDVEQNHGEEELNFGEKTMSTHAFLNEKPMPELEANDQKRIFRDITNDYSMRQTEMPPVQNMMFSSSNPTDTNTNTNTKNYYLPLKYPQNEDTLEVEKPVIKLRRPEEIMGNDNEEPKENIRLSSYKEDQKPSMSTKPSMTFLPPLESKDTSMPIVRIKYTPMNMDSDSDDEEIKKVMKSRLVQNKY